MCGYGEFDGGSIYLGFYGASLTIGEKEYKAVDLRDLREALDDKTKEDLIEMFVDIILSGSDE